MSVFRLTNKFLLSNKNITQYIPILSQNRFLSVGVKQCCAEQTSEEKAAEIRSDKDRTKIIPLDISIKYLKSEAYKTTYGDKLIWELYRRNHKGLFPPRKTRKRCIRKGVISTGLWQYTKLRQIFTKYFFHLLGNPCPICRDEYLVIDYQNLDLLKQFISPHTGEVCFIL